MIERRIGNKNELPLELQRDVVKDLRGFLAQGDTLLLLSGGSVAKDLASPLVRDIGILPRDQKLHVALVDERFFVEPGHKDSNMDLLRDIGVLDVMDDYRFDISMVPFDRYNTRENATIEYGKILKDLFEKCSGRIVGLFGIGPDGHTAGIKPQKDMATYQNIFENDTYVVSFQGEDFERVTMTPRAILEVARPYIYAVGDNKKDALLQLLHGKAEDIYKYPAIIFQQHPQVFLYTDQNV